MSASALIGLQWGDEGKGKMVDIFARDVDCVVRCQGGANAGHTVKVGDETTVLHLVPSGILAEGVDCVIGNGVVVDPEQLLAEIEKLEKKGVKVEGRLRLSDRAHVVFAHHKLLDRAQEEARGAAGIGTTRRGIGPCYEDKVARGGIRSGDLLDDDRLHAKLALAFAEKGARLGALASELGGLDAAFEKYRALGRRLAPFISDTVAYVLDCVRQKRRILLEGAQGALLDVDLGSYPYVTSSNTTVGGLLAGSGIPPRALELVRGVCKAYSTRVGAGPYPTELPDATGDLLRKRGGEFGATTGRPRRCGWFDAVSVRFAVETNGVDEIVLTKSDILSGFETLKVCVAYEIDGKTVRSMPGSSDDLARAKPVYESVAGWKEEIGGCRDYDRLPAALRGYVSFLEKECGAPVRWVSVGPTRDALIVRK